MSDHPTTEGGVQMDLKEFQESGLLMLVNMAVLWPRGYALTIGYYDDGPPDLYVQDFGEYMAGYGESELELDHAQETMQRLVDHELKREQQLVANAQPRG